MQNISYNIHHAQKWEKERMLEKENKEYQMYQQNINKTFGELIYLAQQNHANFYARFQEVYPELQQKLLKINPDLQISELTLSAYIYLGFQTKEIAEYTFKSVKTIQNRKNRLRKKLRIPSSTDLYVLFKT